MVEYIRDLGRSITLVRRAAPVEATALLVCLVLQGMIPAALIWITKSVVDMVVLTGADALNTADLMRMALLWVGGLLLESSLSPWAAALQGNLNEQLTAHVNLSLMRKADALPGVEAFESSEFYDELQILRDQAAYQPVNLLVYLTNGLREVVLVASVLAILAPIAPWIPLLILAASIPHAVVLFRLQRDSWETMVWKSPQARLMQYLSSLLLTDQYAKESKLFRFGPWLIQRYRVAFDDTHRAMRRVRTRQAVWSNALTLVSALGNGFAFVWVVRLVALGSTGPGSIVLIVQSLLLAQQNLLLLAQDTTMLQDTQRYFRLLFKFLDHTPAMQTTNPALAPPKSLTTGISLEGVTFRYPDGREALSDVSMVLEPGKITALVGENGAGKSTVAKLLARFYDPQAGRILIDGRDLRTIDLAEWRSQVGAVFQDFGRYHLSVQENITFTDSVLNPHDPSTQRILRQSDLLDLVSRLPEGLRTQLGKQFNGTELSGGEWQKVAIARALARNDAATLLILDEPTASLDPRSEYELYKDFAALARGVTTLLITHRLGSVRMADRIYVLEHGRVVEEGTHSALVASGGLYAALWSMQASTYSPPEAENSGA